MSSSQQRELSRLGNDAEAIEEAAKQSVNTYRTQCQTYAIKEKKYEKQQSRIVNTRTAILSPLDKAIHDRVAHITSPKILYDTIVSMNKNGANYGKSMKDILSSMKMEVMVVSEPEEAEKEVKSKVALAVTGTKKKD
ncbi:uncharacterized protein MYCGRDRAFT_97917 [Zymoseptoria tritici IPO323]|uniref:Uncharacterized protein n=1 Tax=Zymoseptoria tritici (strain CBS 115943 / IPO323) TaxID=336722 RepID=F9XRS1_ZYMTI|nr:uncharacterized protein MYCGRDRAFT_97917 [Zymoseptoria tritici IPO323]EGP82048.1 hypothetical protein MYCGRDRAFT_97917 [Zymoseptoria tritici IPO323]